MKRRPTLLILLSALALTLGRAAPAHAQAMPQHYTFAQLVESCNGDLFYIVTDCVFVSQVTTDQNGGTHVHMDGMCHGQGTDLVTGIEYVFNTPSSIDYNSSGPPPFEFTNVDYNVLVSEGGTPNLYVFRLEHITIPADGAPPIITQDYSFDCRG